MSQHRSKTNGAAKPNGHAAEPAPSKTTLAIQDQIDALYERLATERARDKGRAELLAFVTSRALTRRDVLDVAKSMLPSRGKAAHKTRMKIGFTEPNGKIDGKLGKAMVAARKRKNLSRHQLGSLVGVTFHSINAWEAGVGRPNAKHHPALIKAGVPAAMLTAP
jgi:DNA-binding XRE family transcriptional regulator